MLIVLNETQLLVNLLFGFKFASQMFLIRQILSNKMEFVNNIFCVFYACFFPSYYFPSFSPIEQITMDTAIGD